VLNKTTGASRQRRVIHSSLNATKNIIFIVPWIKIHGTIATPLTR
jgi:hypothetical protein